MLQVSNGEAVPADPNETIDFVEIVRDVKTRDGRTLFALRMMPNRFHIDIRKEDVYSSHEQDRRGGSERPLGAGDGHGSR